MVSSLMALLQGGEGAFGQQGAPPELSDKPPRPEAAHAHQGSQIEQPEKILPVMGISWLDPPEDVDEPNTEQSAGHGYEGAQVFLDVAKQQQQEGQSEVEDNQKHGNPFPPAPTAAEIPWDLLGQ